jgi:hypothetical protein
MQLFFKFTLPNVPVSFSMKDELMCLFLQDGPDQVLNTLTADQGIPYLPWRIASFVFNQIKPFFDSDAYSEAALKGLVVSSGGLTESTLKASQNSLFEYLSEAAKIKNSDGSIDKAAGIQKKQSLIGKLLRIFEASQKQDRVTVPLMKTIEMLLSADYLSEAELEPLMLEIHRVSVAECNKSKNISKLTAGVGVFSGMLSLPSVEA